MASVRWPVASLLCALAASSAFAILPTELPPGLAAPTRLRQATHWDAEGRHAGARAFVESVGGTWHARIDANTGRPAMIFGSGIPWVPGRGNTLSWPDVAPGVAAEPSPAKTLAILDARARAFMGAHPGLLGVGGELVELMVDPKRSGSIGSGRVRYLTYEVRRAGVTVEGAEVFFRLSHGNLVQFGTAHVSDALRGAPTSPAITAEQALSAATARLDAAFATAVQGSGAAGAGEIGLPGSTLSEIVDAGTLRLTPELASPARAPGDGLDYRLTWRVAFRSAGRHETWTALVDAVSGKVIAAWDANHYACPTPAQPRGRVTGGVYIGPIEDVPESSRGLQHALVLNGGPKVADYNGSYDYQLDTPAQTGLNGRFVDMNCQGCNNPPQANVVNDGWGDLNLGFGGADQNGNGYSTRAERNCYYHINHVRMQAAKHIDDATANGFLDNPLPANVNLNNACNAFWNGTSINFYRSSAACNNTGEIADVMQHEWGHGLDANTGGINDGGRSEGLSDVVAFLATHDPRLAPYFQRGNRNGIRNADEATSGRGVMTLSGMDAECGGEVHCEGELFSQAWWHLAGLLRADAAARTTPPSEQAGWYVTERLFYQSLAPSDTFVPDQAGSTYDAVMLVDDEDGNLANGTPNAEFINAAFLHHEIASTPQVLDAAACVPPAAPALTAATAPNALTLLWQVQLSWADVPGAIQYDVYRNDDAGVGGDVLAGIVFPPATTFVDDNVTDGVSYRYRVAAFDAAGCFSIDDNVQSVSIPGSISLSLADFRVSDELGNANGIAEPGETLVISVDVSNVGTQDATAVTGTLLVDDPTVVLTDDTTAFGDVAAGATAAGPDAFLVELPRTLICGDSLVFTVSIDAAEGCSRGSATVAVGRLVGYADIFVDDFELDRGWIVDPAGPDPALTSGRFERVNPQGTTAQPEDDHTPAPGALCYVTDGRAGAGAGTYDVDGGCTVLQSPVVDLAGATGVELSYWRFFNMTTSTDDELVVEISNDGGGAWRDVERLASSAPAWTQVVVSLDQVLGEPAQLVVLRFTTCDGAPGSLLEALVDDVALRQAVISCEPPDARPRLGLTAHVVGDGTALGGRGNADGIAEPGEAVVVALDLENAGNAAATRVAGRVSITSAPLGVGLSDGATTWPDIDVGQTRQSADPAPRHVGFAVDPSVACGGVVELQVDVTYDGPAGTYSTSGTVQVTVGSLVETLVLFDDFEGGDNGWTHGTNCGGGGCDPQDDWQHGTPGGASAYDPLLAWSGTRAWGNDLGAVVGGVPWNGLYRPDIDNYLESPPLDFTGLTGATISFRRWLTAEDGDEDRARILVDGTTVWSNPIGPDFLDTEWAYQEIDISALADGRSVQVRFELQADGGGQFGGWNLDDFRASVSSWVCNPVDCGGLPCIEVECRDGVDDDGDGLIDCADPDCGDGRGCGETSCGNGLDDDGDGRIDCGDADCADAPDADCDGDGELAATDCDDADPGARAIPARVARLDVTRLPAAPLDDATLLWTSVIASGGPATVHDVLTGLLTDLHRDRGITAAVCLGSAGAATTLLDGRTVDVGGTWYLVQGRNGCGRGTLGPGRTTTGMCP